MLTKIDIIITSKVKGWLLYTSEHDE